MSDNPNNVENEKVGNIVYNRDSVFDIITISVIPLLAIALISFILHFLAQDKTLYVEDGKSSASWIMWVIILSFLSLLYYIILLNLNKKLGIKELKSGIKEPDNKKFRQVLFGYFLLILFFVFCLVNSTGGITSSPFVSLYPAIITITIITSDKTSTVFAVMVLISLAVILSFIFQWVGWVTQKQLLVTKSDEILYYIEYAFVLLVTIIGIGIADFKRSTSKR